MKISDVPVVGGIVDGISSYFKTTQKIISENKHFISHSHPVRQEDLRASMKYFEAGIVAGLAYLVPFFVVHEQSMSKFIFVLQQVIAIFIYTFFVSLSCKFLKVQGVSFSKLLTIMGYLWGFMFFLNFVIATPVLVAIGPNFLFQGADNTWVQQVDQDTLLTFSMVAIVSSVGFIALWLYLILPWVANTFNITKKKTLGALLLGGVPSGLIIGFILGPIAKHTESALGNWLIAF